MLRREPVPPGAVKPEFIQRLQDIEIVEGSAAKFDVRVKGTVLFLLLFLLSGCGLCIALRKKLYSLLSVFTVWYFDVGLVTAIH